MSNSHAMLSETSVSSMSVLRLDLVGVGEVEADSADQQLPPEECAALRGEGVYVVGDKRNRNP